MKVTMNRFEQFIESFRTFVPNEIDYKITSSKNTEKVVEFLFKDKTYKVTFTRVSIGDDVIWAVKFVIKDDEEGWTSNLKEFSFREVKVVFACIYFVILQIVNKYNFKALAFKGSDERRDRIYKKIMVDLYAKNFGFSVYIYNGYYIVTKADLFTEAFQLSMALKIHENMLN